MSKLISLRDLLNYNKVTKMSRDEINNQNTRNDSSNNIESVISVLFHRFSKIWNQLLKCLDGIMRDIGGYKVLDHLSKETAKHPCLAIGLSIVFLIVMLPLLIILIFVLSTIFMTFTGFIFIEGTLITVASVALLGCLAGVLITFLFFGCLIIAGYFGFMQIYDLFYGTKKTALKNFVKKEKSKNI